MKLNMYLSHNVEGSSTEYWTTLDDILSDYKSSLTVVQATQMECDLEMFGRAEVALEDGVNIEVYTFLQVHPITGERRAQRLT